MELLAVFACLAPCLMIPLLGFAIWMGVDAGRRNTRRAEEQTTVLEQIGLESTGSGPWRVGRVGGRAVAVKAQRAARVNHYDGGGVHLRVKLCVLFPVDVSVAEHVYRNNPGRSAETFDRHYYGTAGKPAQGVPEAVRTALLDWALEVPTDRAEVGPRSSSSLYAADQFPDAETLVRVEGAGRLEKESLEEWLRACARRVDAMEAQHTGADAG